MKCTVYNVQCTLYSIQCTVYSAQCSLYTFGYWNERKIAEHGATACASCTECTVQCTVYIVLSVAYVQVVLLEERKVSASCVWTATAPGPAPGLVSHSSSFKYLVQKLTVVT